MSTTVHRNVLNKLDYQQKMLIIKQGMPTPPFVTSINVRVIQSSVHSTRIGTPEESGFAGAMLATVSSASLVCFSPKIGTTCGYVPATPT